MRQFVLMAIASLALSFSVQAQKFGYVDSQALLMEMEEVKAAESNLKAFRDIKQKAFEEKIQKFQAELNELERRNAEGELTPKMIQEEQVRMQAKQEELAQEEAKIADDLSARREKEFQPIFDRVNTAIASVAKEEGMVYIFEGGAGGVILYADDSMDITDKVKSKLMASQN